MTIKSNRPRNKARRKCVSRTTVLESKSADFKQIQQQSKMQAYLIELRKLLSKEKSLRAAEGRQQATRPRGVQNANAKLNQLSKKVQDSAFRTVSAAIEYGYANNIIKRMGNCFVLKERKATPTPARSRHRLPARQFCCTRCRSSFIESTKPRQSMNNKRNICEKCGK